MVLQPANSRLLNKKRVLQTSNLENTPPQKYRRLSFSIREASRRRRTRVVSGSHKSRYARDVRHRKSKANSAAHLRSQHTAAAPLKNVEMKDAETLAFRLAATDAGVPKISVNFPRHLPRPDFRAIDRSILEANEPGVARIPVKYIQQSLEVLGPDLYKVLSSVQSEPVIDSLPKELSIIVNDLSSHMPSHLLAVYAQTAANVPSRRNKVILYPSHNIVLAVHCANLPLLPVAHNPTPIDPGTSITVPIVPLCIPAPELYTPLSLFLYTKRVDLLLQVLLPTMPLPSLNVYALPDETPEEAKRQHDGILSFAQRLAATYTPHALLHYAMRVNGFWRNVCALGISEQKTWSVMDFAWEILILALAIATGQAEKVIGKLEFVEPTPSRSEQFHSYMI